MGISWLHPGKAKGNAEVQGNCRHAVHQSVGTQTLGHKMQYRARSFEYGDGIVGVVWSLARYMKHEEEL